MRLNKLNQPIGNSVDDWKGAQRPNRTPLTGRYCSLVRLNPEKHAASLYKHNQLSTDDANWTYLSYGPFQSEPAYTNWLRESATKEDPYFYAVMNNEGEAIGVASYLRIKPESGSIEVGHINFSPALQKSVMATEAMYLMMKYAFELGYRRYEWKCDALNEPSRAAALRLGMQFEGLFRQWTIYKGRNRDTAWFSILDNEWPAMRARFEAWLSLSNFDENGMQRVSLSLIE